jgi:RNA polymerase sigma factor (sigma-70 family)
MGQCIPIAPLTADQQALVTAHVPFARRIAARLTVGRPQFRDEAEGAAFEALCRLAARYDPASGATFETYATPRLVGAVWDAMRKWGTYHRMKRSETPETFNLDALSPYRDDSGNPLSWHDVLASQDDPPGAAEESIDAVRGMLRGLPRGRRDVMERLYTRADCCRVKDTGRALGLCETRISQIHSEVIAILRKRFQAGVEL